LTQRSPSTTRPWREPPADAGPVSEPITPEVGGELAAADKLERRGARGMLVLTAANSAYIASAYAITVWLAHHLGPSDFGRYGVVTAIISLISIAVTRSVPVATTRAIAAHPGSAHGTIVLSARVMVPLVLAAGGLAAASAAPLAEVLGDDRLRVPLVIGAFAAITYGVQALPLAWFAGMHQHGRQALAQLWYAISRLAAIVVGGQVGGLAGAISGFVAAPALGTLATLGSLRIRPRLTPRPGSQAPSVTGPELLRSSAPLVGVAALVSLLLTVDLLAFKSVGSAADAGRYAAAATIAHVPFFLLRSVPIVLMPAVAARAAPSGSGEQTRQLAVQNEVRRGVGDALVLLALPTALLVALGDRALELVFGTRYSVDDLVVAPLALATAAITLYAAFVAVDTALGTLRASLMIGVVGSLLVAVAAAVGGQGSNVSRTAWGVAVATAVTVVAHGLILRARVGPFIPARGVAAVGLATIVGVITLATPEGAWWLVASVVCASAAYGAIAMRARLVQLR
jgi:O-antigen/teichoic acid export membrane protein